MMNRLVTNTGVLWLLLLTLTGSDLAYGQRLTKKKQKDAATVRSDQFRPEEEGLVVEGMKFMVRGEPERALAVFGQLVEKAPEDAAGYYLLATALNKLERTQEAIDAAQKAYQRDKSNLFYGKFLAENLSRQKNYKEAAVIYEELLLKDPSNIQNNIELAAVYVFTDQFDKAIDTYNRLEKNIGVTEEVVRQKQQLYLRQNKLEKAIEESQKLIASEPGESYYYIELAELYIANELLDKAIPALQDALKINPDEAQAHVLLADIYRRQGDLTKCNTELQIVFKNPNLDVTPKIRVLSGFLTMLKTPQDRSDAMELAKLLIHTHPSESKPYVLYADLLTQTNQREKARDAYAIAARLDGSIYEIWGALLQLDGELNAIDSLLVHSELALEVFPNQGMLWYSNGMANLAKRNFKQAVSALEESKRLIGDNPSMVQFINAQLGDAYNGVGDHEKSDEFYELVLKENPDNDHVLNNYSYFLSLRKEKLDKALKMSSQLVKRNPDNATYLDTHAWVLYVRKDYRQAKDFLEKALADQQNISATIVEHYGDVLSRLGEHGKALEQWKKAKEMGQLSELIDKKIASGTLHEQ